MNDNRSIWKFVLDLNNVNQCIAMPPGARIVHVNWQNGLCLWAEVLGGQSQTEDRTFVVHGTGHFIPKGTYVGTVMAPPFVWHVYETTGGAS